MDLIEGDTSLTSYPLGYQNIRSNSTMTVTYIKSS